MTEELPVKLKPRKDHEALRMREIIHAIHRYSKAGLLIPVEWTDELIELLKWEPRA